VGGRWGVSQDVQSLAANDPDTGSPLISWAFSTKVINRIHKNAPGQLISVNAEGTEFSKAIAHLVRSKAGSKRSNRPRPTLSGRSGNFSAKPPRSIQLHRSAGIFASVNQARQSLIEITRDGETIRLDLDRQRRESESLRAELTKRASMPGCTAVSSTQ
jgi:hypothetical protein